MDIAIKAAQFILSLSILIVLHELGHFIPAKLFKTKVEKFYLFFDYKFSLIKKKIGDTVYGIGWIPLGGYVKIAGMIDESMDKEQMNKEPEDWEFRAKPTWQRLIIMVGGVAVNLILGFLIYAMVLYTWGSEKLPISSATNGMHIDSLLINQGLQEGDVITKIGEKDIHYFKEINTTLIVDDYTEITVKREGAKVVVPISEDFKEQLLEANPKAPLAEARVPYVIDSAVADYPAALAGLKRGDQVIAIEGNTNPYALDVLKTIKANKEKELAILVKRAGGDTAAFSIQPNEDGILGIFAKAPATFLETETVNYTFLESIPAGYDYCMNTLGNYVSSMKLLFTPAGAKSIGGFASIGNLFPGTWDWHAFWNLTAFLSIILAVMNILPIPALDGGHVMFLIWEMITGKAPAQKVLEYAQMVGMILVLGLVLFANGNDLFKLFMK